jgi:hypothetical protein
MQEACYCGRSGDIQDRNPLMDSNGMQALECPDCGNADYLRWLPEETSLLLLEEAKHRREVLADERRPAA